LKNSEGQGVEGEPIDALTVESSSKGKGYGSIFRSPIT
jgi:hypothetical protein